MHSHKSYKINPNYLAKIDNVLPAQHPKSKVKRTYGWSCPFLDYTSNRHYNTQRHIHSVHGIGSGVPVDHTTGETREEKRRAAANESHSQSMSMSVYSTGTRPVPTPVGNPGEYYDTTLSANPISMPYLEAQERRLKELGYPVPRQAAHNYGPYPAGHTVPAQSAHNYRPHPVGTADWANAPHHRNISATNRTENAINHYPSQSNQLYNPPSSGYRNISPGPLDGLIDILFRHESLRRSLR
jgi:hypothetical protein